MYVVLSACASADPNHSSTPGFSTITSCPCTGRTATSGTSSRAPSPEQLTTVPASRPASASEVNGRRCTVPPARARRRSRYRRWDGMSTSGIAARQPAPQPGGSSSGVARRSPGTAACQPSGSASPASAIVPVTSRTPVSAGRAASSVSRCRERSDQATARTSGRTR